MGSGESKIIHETVETSDPGAREEGQRLAQKENEEKVRQLNEEIARQEKQALEEVEQRARCEDEAQRRQLEKRKREREEKEKKLKEEKEFRELKSALMEYDFQLRPRIRKESFRDLDVSDIDLVRIALIGPAGSGKTSFVATLQRALGQKESSAFAQGTGGEGTIHLEEYFVQKHVSMVDTRGFFLSEENLFEECLNIMSGRIRPGEEIVRNHDQTKGQTSKSPTKTRGQVLAKFAHAVIFVLKANDIRLNNYKDKLKKIRNHFREDGYAPVTVITFLDELEKEGQKGQEKQEGLEKRKEDAFDRASSAAGSSSERTFFIANYTEEQKQTSMTVERTALDVLDFALLSAERFIQIRKQKEKNQMERELAGGASGGKETLEQFFGRLKKKYKWNDQGQVKEVLSSLRSNEIKTVIALKELWETLKPDLPLSIGMKKCLEEEISKI
ncbi:myb-like protein X [Acropora muricata]|uniref:myb-like protein X n=1 Tax=Acropora muricata TaxID=159855 RepID=UPI0034E5ADFD